MPPTMQAAGGWRSATGRFQIAQDHSPVGMAITDLEGRWVDVNRALCRMLGRSEAELRGMSVDDVTAPDDAAAGVALRAVLASGQCETGSGVTRFVTSRGRIISVQLSLGLVRDERGEPQWVSLQAIDITDRLHAEDKLATAHRELARHARELERSNAALEQFAYVASHDLSEPLRTVSGYVQLLQRRYGGQLGGEGEEFVELIVDGVVRMQRLLQDLLAFSQVARGEERLVPVDCAALVRGLSQRLVGADGVATEVTAGDLPVVIADEAQMRQLFANLMENAVKFVAPGVVPRVHVGARRGEGGWVFSVTDNGIGIQPRHRERIFLMFQRLHSRDEYPGTGIGLALCKAVVERRGGSIRIEASEGGGCVFSFDIPDVQE